jgi:hypothetical protein
MKRDKNLTKDSSRRFPLVRFETFIQAIRDSGYKGIGCVRGVQVWARLRSIRYLDSSGWRYDSRPKAIRNSGVPWLETSSDGRCWQR